MRAAAGATRASSHVTATNASGPITPPPTILARETKRQAAARGATQRRRSHQLVPHFLGQTQSEPLAILSRLNQRVTRRVRSRNQTVNAETR